MLRAWAIEEVLGNDTRVFAKLEFLQRTGTFKARGALASLAALDAEQRARGVTAVSAGNHAVATAFAAKTVGAHAKIVMTASANEARVQACADYGAEIVRADTVHDAFEQAEAIKKTEGRAFIHPFDGKTISMGTGTLGLEMLEQCPEADAVIVSIGGGGLISGIAIAIGQAHPACAVHGVEPEGADTMTRSLASGKAESIPKVNTIADSLGAPYASDYTHAVCERYLASVVRVSDDAMKDVMGWSFHRMKMALEPACIASVAALFGPLREALAGKTVVVLLCGSIIDWPTFERQANLSVTHVD